MKTKHTAQSGFSALRISLTILVWAFASWILGATVLGFFRAEAPNRGSQAMLTFAERVAYQHAIEDIYWRHRIWPKESSHPKPSLDAVMSQAQVEKKVADYLRKSQALEDNWQRPITPEQLQAEMDRMTRDTKQPAVLRELFDALGNDPFVIAECLARPVLAEQLVTKFSAHDLRIHGELKVQPEYRRASADNRAPDYVAAAGTSYRLPTVSDRPDGCIDDTWTATSTSNAPARRTSHTAVWTGSEMIVWGGFGGSYLNTGGRYDPSTNSWTPISTMNAPAPRGGNTAVWTGTEMIVWGGDDGQSVNTGGRYNPANDTWTTTNTTNAPLGRIFHTAVWDGSEMIVWGGWNEVELGTGGRYNPGTDAWTATSTNNAPTARYDHTAVWTGNEMIVWGGWNGSNAYNTGGRYNPGTDAWTATGTTNAPTARYDHTAVWTSNEMIVWGGRNAGSYFNSGGKYSPSTDNWGATSTTNAPVARFAHTAVWNGSDMIVWGGTNMQKQFNTGGRYTPGTDNWMATGGNAPEQRAYHTAVWSGSEMIVWGGITDVGPFFLNTGGRYCAQSTPTPTPTVTPTESCLVKQVSFCNSTVFAPPTDFIVQMSCPVDQVQPSGFMVNNIGANSFTVSNFVITFHFNASPAVPGLNTIHILNDAITCCIRPVNEFTCTFTYVNDTPTPTPTATSTPTPSPRATPVTRPRLTPHPRP